MLANHEGQRVPQVTFRTRRNGQWVDIGTEEIFKGRNVVVFALPGAYTPTCSTSSRPMKAMRAMSDFLSSHA